MSTPRERPAPRPEPDPHGLCPRCVHVRRVVSDKGSVFWRCELSREKPGEFPRYPPQPRMVCTGFAR